MSDRRRNVFVVGYDAYHAEDLHAIPHAERFHFHPLLHSREVIGLETYDVEGLIERARAILDAFDGPIDAILGHWSFPVNFLVPLLCEERGLRSPGLAVVLKCAHKYWARLEQSRHIPECTPPFCAIDPFSDDPVGQVAIDYPFWVKPVTGYGSVLGFRIDGPDDLRRAMEEARRRIRRFGEPFDRFLARADLPEEVAHVDGNHMIAEGLIGGIEVAPEGYVQHGRFHAHGMVDMLRGENGKSFCGYRYPSTCSRALRDRVVDVSRRILAGIGFDDGCFNIEYFYDESADRLWIIEINPRISQSHSRLFEKVDGMSNHEIAVHVALGDKPHFRHGGGHFGAAAKFLYRRYDEADARCVRAPTREDRLRLAERQPETSVKIALQEGMRLSELVDQDPYSYVLAELVIGGRDAEDLDRRFTEAQELLPFEFEPVEAEEDG